MRSLLIIGALALAAAGALWLFQNTVDVSALCNPDEACVREWLGATGGWAAVIAAFLTIFYLSKQISDTDRQQKTAFMISLRQQRILASRTAQIAGIALLEIEKQEREHTSADIRPWDRETIEGLIHHLRDTTISSFQSEIAHPHSLNAWATSIAIERAYAGVQPAVQIASELTHKFFTDLARQADDFLGEVKEITGQRSKTESFGLD